ncbi:MAG: Uma2 family endonuclease, partial [Chloroflexota bacterium]
MSQSPGLKHQRVYSRLQFSLYEPLKIERRGLLLGRCGVRLSASTLIVPDILFVSRERRSIVGEAYIDGAPDLLGEIISPTTDIIDRVR